MVQACRYAIAGQVAALMALVLTEVLPVGARVGMAGLEVACGLEAIGYGAGALAALRGSMQSSVGRLELGSRVLFSLVLWGLAVRHAVLLTDPMNTGSLLVSGTTWGLGLASWVVLAASLVRGPSEKAAPLSRQAAWLAAVAVAGGLNTLAMAARRAVL